MCHDYQCASLQVRPKSAKMVLAKILHQLKSLTLHTRSGGTSIPMIKAIFRTKWHGLVAIVLGAVAILGVAWINSNSGEVPRNLTKPKPKLIYQPRTVYDLSGFSTVQHNLKGWPADASLDDVSRAWKGAGFQIIGLVDQALARPNLPDVMRIRMLFDKVVLLNYEGQPQAAYRILEELRSHVEGSDPLAAESLFSIIFAQGVTSLRRGEDENCILCRGESSCIIPISPAAIHTFPQGSQQAIHHFSEYLKEFPDDLEVCWLLNLAHMTLGEYPQKVDPQARLTHLLVLVLHGSQIGG
jgi:hypothetical protein